MPSKTKAINKVKKTRKNINHDDTFNSIAEIMARLGYGSRGLIYFVMGLLALLISLGNGGNTTDLQGTIATIGQQPQGRILLWLILIGLICYSLWGLIEAVLNPLHKDNDIKGVAKRVVYLFISISYFILALATYSLITGGARPAHNGKQNIQTKSYVAKLLTMPLGQSMVFLVAIIVILAGIFQVYKGIMPRFGQQLYLIKLTQAQLKWVKDFGRFGTISRGIIIILIGIFLIIAAYTSNSNEAKGLDSALMSLIYQPYGIWLMGSIALGLMSFGVYSLLIALFFRLRK